MITSVRMVNFKNFADETLKVGPFTVIVGANASGKSNIRDAFRFLHGIGRGYTLWRRSWGASTGSRGDRWSGKPIRGAPNEIARLDPEFGIYPFHEAASVRCAGWNRTLGRTKAFYSING